MPTLKRQASFGIVSAAGKVAVQRGYYQCEKCHATSTPWDDWAGLDKGHLSLGARRLASLAARNCSFDEASENLREFTGLEISDQTIRRVSESEGTQAAAWLDDSYVAGDKYRQAKGEHEFSTDGTMVNTREGWKEIRLITAAKRCPGKGIEPAAWREEHDRDLPPPTACFTTARFASSDEMPNIWRALAARLGLNAGKLSALADGAKHIWKNVSEVFPHADQVLDVYHGSEHVHLSGKALYGEKSEEAPAWSEERLSEIIEQGPATCLWNLNRLHEQDQSLTEGKKAELKGLIGYIEANQDRMPYARRLREGRAIGSGKIEGSCKNTVGKRLKMNNARWNFTGATGIATLRCLHYSGLWDAYFDHRQAT